MSAGHPDEIAGEATVLTDRQVALSRAEQAWLREQASHRYHDESRTKYVPHQGAREKARRQVQRLQRMVTPELRRQGFRVQGGGIDGAGIVWVCADCGAVVPEMAVVPDTPCCQARLAAWRARDEGTV